MTPGGSFGRAGTAALMAGALAVAGCTGSGDRAPANLASRSVGPVADAVAAPQPAREADPESGLQPDAEPESGPIQLGDRVEVIEQECYGSESRCGLVLVPQVDGSHDLVGIGFREWSPDGGGDPLVIVEWDGLGMVDGDDFPDRPVVLVGGRHRWPGGPEATCALLDTITVDDTAEEVTTIAAECRAWLADAGIDLAGASRRMRASDVANTIAALGHESVSVVAAGQEAELVARIAPVLTVESAVYVNPDFHLGGSARSSMAVLVDTMVEGWQQCQQAPVCEPVGSIDDFFDAVAALESDPLPHPWLDGEVIDTSLLLNLLVSLARDTRSVAALPELHRALLDRDAETVARFLRRPYSSRSAIHDLATSCQYGAATDVPDEAHPLLATHARWGRGAFRAACDGLGVAPAEDPDPWPGLSVETRSVSGSQSDRDGIGPVVVEPTVGWPTPPCLVTTITAYLDAGAVDDSACRDGLRFATRDDPIVPVTASVPGGSARTISLLVPDGWVSTWSGSWAREADIRDDTSLWVYTWEGDDAETVLDEVVWDYDIDDEARSTRTIEGRTWLLAEGSDYDDNPLLIAVTELGETPVVLELTAEPEAADRMVRDVLEPAMESVSLDDTGS